MLNINEGFLHIVSAVAKMLLQSKMEIEKEEVAFPCKEGDSTLFLIPLYTLFSCVQKIGQSFRNVGMSGCSFSLNQADSLYIHFCGACSNSKMHLAIL